jgi:prephenate dehydrogenase
MSPTILHIGLDTVGTSIGLALGRRDVNALRLGFDWDGKHASAVRQSGAIDEVAPNLRKAAGQADLAIISTPIDELGSILDIIGPRLKTGALVIDTDLHTSTAFAWAAEKLPAGRHFLGAIPVIGPQALEEGSAGRPRADLFENGLMGLVIPPGTPQEPVQFALSMAHLLGATPFFIDAQECDSVAAAAEDLPVTFALALMHSSIRGPGWAEVERMAGKLFAEATEIGTHHEAKKLSTILALNRRQLISRLDGLTEQLSILRQLLEGEDDRGLEAYVEAAQQARAAWIGARRRADWEQREIPRPPIGSTNLFGHLFGITPRERKKPKSS